jgi:hypothetical protein
MRKIPSPDLAYAAGLVDGEGTITLGRSAKNENRAPVLSVASTSPELLAEMIRLFGGYRVRHKKYKQHHRSSFSWRISHRPALAALALLLPFLKEKRKLARARHILRGYDACTKRNGRYSHQDKKKKAVFEAAFFRL